MALFSPPEIMIVLVVPQKIKNLLAFLHVLTPSSGTVALGSSPSGAVSRRGAAAGHRAPAPQSHEVFLMPRVRRFSETFRRRSSRAPWGNSALISSVTFIWASGSSASNAMTSSARVTRRIFALEAETSAEA